MSIAPRLTKNPPFEVRFEEITPQYAQHVLDNHNAADLTYGSAKKRGNRKPSDSRVKGYSHEMQEQWWRTTHQGIAFDENGHLIDGQNRLLAIVDSKTTQTMLVSRGVPAETFYLLDQGMSRSAHQFLDGTYGTLRGALARTLMRLGEKDGVVDSTIGAGKYPAYRILQFLDDNPQVVKYGAEEILRANGEPVSYAAVAAGAKRGSEHSPFRSTSAAGLLVAGFLLGDDDLRRRWFEDILEARADAGLLNLTSPLRHFLFSKVADGNMTNVNYRRAMYVATLVRDGKQAKTYRGKPVALDIPFLDEHPMKFDTQALGLDLSALGSAVR